MQDPHPTQPSAEASNPVKAFSAWWNIAFAEFLAGVEQHDTSLYFVMDCFSIFIKANYQMQAVLEVYIHDLNRLVQTDQIDQTNRDIFLRRRSPEGQTITDVVRDSRISLANYPHAASFFNLGPTVQPSMETVHGSEIQNNRRR